MLNHGAFSEKIRLLRYMEMRGSLGSKCSSRASQRRVSRHEAAGETSESDVESRLAEARE